MKISTIETYPIVYANFENFISCFHIFIVLRLKHYILDLNLGFLDGILKVTDKVV